MKGRRCSSIYYCMSAGPCGANVTKSRTTAARLSFGIDERVLPDLCVPLEHAGRFVDVPQHHGFGLSLSIQLSLERGLLLIQTSRIKSCIDSLLSDVRKGLVKASKVLLATSVDCFDCCEVVLVDQAFLDLAGLLQAI